MGEYHSGGGKCCLLLLLWRPAKSILAAAQGILLLGKCPIKGRLVGEPSQVGEQLGGGKEGQGVLLGSGLA